MKTIAPEILAAWESATVQNCNPVLSDADAQALWDAIVAFRASQDLAAFSATARAMAPHVAIAEAITSLTALLPVVPIAADAANPE